MSPLAGVLAGAAIACGVTFLLLFVWAMCDAAKAGDEQRHTDDLRPKPSGVHVYDREA